MSLYYASLNSKDSVYFLKQAVKQGDLWEAYSPELDERIVIEDGIVRPLLLGDQVHRFDPIDSDNLVLFPYDDSADEFPPILSATSIQRKFPRGWEYLKRCETILRARENGRFDVDEWYQFGRKQGINEGGRMKLLAPDISLGGNFSIDRSGDFYTTTTLYGYIKHDKVWESYEFLLAILNSKVLWFYLKNSGSVLANGYFRYKPAYLQNFPVPEVSREHESALAKLVSNMLAHKATATAEPAATQFLEDLIDACVMECYFRDHMAQRDLLFLDDLAPHLANYDAKASAEKQRDFITNLHRTLNAPSSKIRNRLLRLTADSPDLLAVIKAEGKA